MATLRVHVAVWVFRWTAEGRGDGPPTQSSHKAVLQVHYSIKSMIALLWVEVVHDLRAVAQAASSLGGELVVHDLCAVAPSSSFGRRIACDVCVCVCVTRCCRLVYVM